MTSPPPQSSEDPARQSPETFFWILTAGAGVALGISAHALGLKTVFPLLATAALVTVLVIQWGAKRWQRDRRALGLLLLLATAAFSHSTSQDLARFTTTSWVRVWNVYHYYLGAKYFPELGYHDLYEASLAADHGGRNYWKKVSKVRNLHTYKIEARNPAAARYRWQEHFQPERWQEFQRDLEAFQQQLPAKGWRGIFRDRGYNPTPFSAFVSQQLTRLLPATNLGALKALTALDLLLLAAAFWALGKTFGLRPLVLCLLFLALSPVNRGRFIGGFLQFDWFCAISLGLCALKRQRPRTAGLLLAYATMTRIFPLLLVAGALFPALAGWLRGKALRPAMLRFGVTFGLSCLIALALGAGAGRGPGGWQEFADNISFHSQQHVFGEQRIGMKQIFTHGPSLFPQDEGSSARRRHGQESALPMYLATALLLLTFAVAALRRNGRDGLLLGMVPWFVLAVSSRYYWACLALLPFLSAATAGARRRRNILTLAQALLYLVLQILVIEQASRYTTYSVFNEGLLVFWALALGLFLVADGRVLGRWRRLRARRARRVPKAL